MLGSNCDLKMRVQNMGHPLPYKSGAQKSPFGLTLQLNVNFHGPYLQNETRYRQPQLTTTRGLLHRPKMSWTLVHKRLKTRPAFLPILHKFCFIAGFADGDQQMEFDQTLPNGGWWIALWICCRAVGVLPPGKNGAKKLWHLFGFLTTSRLNGEYLMNETWRRQLGKGAGKYEGSSTLSKHFMNFGPQMA